MKLSRQKRDSRTRCERHTTDAVTLHDASPRGHQKRLEASYQAGCETAELAPSAIGVRDHGLASSSVEHASQAWVAPKIFQPGLDELPIELLSCPVIAVCSRILSRKVVRAPIPVSVIILPCPGYESRPNAWLRPGKSCGLAMDQSAN